MGISSRPMPLALVAAAALLPGCGALGGPECNPDAVPGITVLRPTNNTQVLTGDVTLEAQVQGCPALPAQITWRAELAGAAEAELADCNEDIEHIEQLLCLVKVGEGDHKVTVELTAADGASYEAQVLFRAAGDPEEEPQD